MSASGITIPRRLRAAAPGWTATADVIVVGSGIAGLTTALRLRRRVARVLLVTKRCSTRARPRGPGASPR